MTYNNTVFKDVVCAFAILCQHSFERRSHRRDMTGLGEGHADSQEGAAEMLLAATRCWFPVSNLTFWAFVLICENPPQSTSCWPWCSWIPNAILKKLIARSRAARRRQIRSSSKAQRIYCRPGIAGLLVWLVPKDVKMMDGNYYYRLYSKNGDMIIIMIASTLLSLLLVKVGHGQIRFHPLEGLLGWWVKIRTVHLVRCRKVEDLTMNTWHIFTRDESDWAVNPLWTVNLTLV